MAIKVTIVGDNAHRYSEMTSGDSISTGNFDRGLIWKERQSPYFLSNDNDILYGFIVSHFRFIKMHNAK